jgi:nitroreductase
MNKIIDDLKWRYATKRFDPNKKIPDSDLAVIKEALQLVATSYGLQSMKFVIVEDPNIREKLVEASYKQRQVVDASHLLVFCSYVNIDDKDVEEYADNISTIRKQERTDLLEFETRMKTTIRNMSHEDKLLWSKRQVYIALGQLLVVCARLRIDSTPMEGFKSSEFDRILGLENKNLTSVLVCPIGYRHDEDTAQFKSKVRKPLDQLFEII